MAYSTPYDYTEDSVRQLDEKFSEIEHDRFLYCIQDQQKWDIEKVNNFIAQLRTSHTFTLKELDRLKELEPLLCTFTIFSNKMWQKFVPFGIIVYLCSVNVLF